MFRAMIVIAVLTALFVGVASADRLNEAHRAYQRADYPTALRILRSLAVRGNANAQNNLGYMYEHGQGVAQNYVSALMWYVIAADNGEQSAEHNLKIIEIRMTRAQIAHGRSMAKICRETNFKHCDTRYHQFSFLNADPHRV